LGPKYLSGYEGLRPDKNSFSGGRALGGTGNAGGKKKEKGRGGCQGLIFPGKDAESKDKGGGTQALWK